MLNPTMAAAIMASVRLSPMGMVAMAAAIMASVLLMLSPTMAAAIMASVLLMRSPTMVAAIMASVLLMLSPTMAAAIMESVRLMRSPTMAVMEAGASVLLMLSQDMDTAGASVLLSPMATMATMVRALPDEKKPPRGRGMTERRGLLCIAIDHGDNMNVTK